MNVATFEELQSFRPFFSEIFMKESLWVSLCDGWAFSHHFAKSSGNFERTSCLRSCLATFYLGRRRQGKIGFCCLKEKDATADWVICESCDYSRRCLIINFFRWKDGRPNKVLQILLFNINFHGWALVLIINDLKSNFFTNSIDKVLQGSHTCFSRIVFDNVVSNVIAYSNVRPEFCKSSLLDRFWV